MKDGIPVEAWKALDEGRITYRVRNEQVRGTVKVTEASKTVQEARVRWYGHLRKREEQHVTSDGHGRWMEHEGKEDLRPGGKIASEII